MNVLVGCEFSGKVRNAFRAIGHNAVSCDLLPAADGSSHHIQGDVLDAIKLKDWDIGIFFPPCTYLCSSGMHWTTRGLRDPQLTTDAVEFVRTLMHCGIPRIAIENPIGVLSTRIRKPDQIIQPWMFGHGETKATCLWLENLPKLTATNIVEGRENRVWKMAPGPDRWAKRSETYQGIADAMAQQWGYL